MLRRQAKHRILHLMSWSVFSVN